MTQVQFMPLGLELCVLGLALLVFIADLLLGPNEKRGLGAFTAMGLAAILVASLLLDFGGESFGVYASDNLGLYFKRTLLLAALIGSIASIDSVDKFSPGRQGEHYFLLLCSLAGMMLLTGAQDALLWVVAFELASIPFYILLALGKDRKGTEAGIKLFLVGAVSSVFVLYGFSLMWGMAGDTSFSTLASTELQPLFVLGMVLVIVGVAFKIGAVPFHLWMADAYQGGPSPVVAILSVAPKVAAFAGLMRLYVEGLLPMREVWAPTFLVLCVASMLIGNLSALPQQDSRRLLALSGVGHMGLLLLALVAGTPEALGALAFYGLAYVVTNMGAMILVGGIRDAEGSADISALNGLAQRSPGLGLAMLLFLLSLGGIPFVVGFWAKMVLFWAAWTSGVLILKSIVVLGVCLSVLALFYYLKMGRAMYIEAPLQPQPVELGLATRIAIGICIGCVVLMGVFPAVFIEPAMDAATQVFAALD
jgi:NADH-quinone oxidoreductase subunit N